MPSQTDAKRDQYLKRVYNITLQQYEQMLQEQHGKCWICGWAWRVGKRRLAVDHSHSTGVVRGLLCYRCNKGLGVFQDRVDALSQAVKYLQHPWGMRGWVTTYKRKRWRRSGRRGMRQRPVGRVSA